MKPWALGAILLLGGDASAQSESAPGVTVQAAPAVSTATVPLKPDWNWRFELNSPPPDDALWKLNLKTSLSAGRDTRLTFGVIGHRGYHLPTYMSESLASGLAAAHSTPSFVDPSTRRSWDALFRVERLLFTTRRGATLRAVTDLHIPLGRIESEPEWQSMRAIRSKAFRFGFVFGF